MARPQQGADFCHHSGSIHSNEREAPIGLPSGFPSKNRNLLSHAYLEIAGQLKQRPRRLAQLHIGELIRRLPIARIFRS